MMLVLLNTICVVNVSTVLMNPMKKVGKQAASPEANPIQQVDHVNVIILKEYDML